MTISIGAFRYQPKPDIVRRRMINQLSTLVTIGRAIALGLLAAALTSCLASTDKLAVFEAMVFSEQQVDALTGYYAWVGERGNASSLIFAPRNKHWPYRPARRAMDGRQPSSERPLDLAAADFTLKYLTLFEDGSSSIIVLVGVAVFSTIPETNLILMSIPGETLRVNNDNGSMEPASEKNASTNLFFILKKDGNEITKQYYPDDDQFLKAAIGDPSNPLPVAELLGYLAAHAEQRFLANELPTYRLATPQTKKLIEQEMNAALSEDREEKAREPATSDALSE